MKEKAPRIAWIALLVLGCLDLIRGFMHTALLDHAAANIAGVSHPDAVFLLRAFGLSNYLTGALFILIALQAKRLAPYVLVLIPASYFLGLLVSPPVASTAQFGGKSFMMVYLFAGLVIGIWGVVEQARAGSGSSEEHEKRSAP